MAQLVALMSGVVLGGVAEVVGSNLARGKIFIAYIGSVDSLSPSVYIYIWTRFFVQSLLVTSPNILQMLKYFFNSVPSYKKII